MPGPRECRRPARRVGAPMTTWGFIGSGNIGSTVARLAVDAGHDVVLSNSRGPETLADLVAELGPHARAATPQEAARAGDVVVVTVPAQGPGRPAARRARRQGGHRHDELLPAARRRGARARGRVDDHLRAAAGARARRQGRQGLQQHLRAAPGRPGPAQRGRRPQRARHRGRRRRGQGGRAGGPRRDRLRHRRPRPARAGLAHPARHRGLRRRCTPSTRVDWTRGANPADRDAVAAAALRARRYRDA